MSRTFAIARYTFHEAIRNKILYSILFFAVALILLGLGIGAASLGQDERILRDVGLFALSFFGDVVAIFVGVTLMYQELQRKSIYTILSKPVARAEYFVGRYLGICMILALQALLMGALLTGAMMIRGDTLQAGWFAALWLAWVESIIVAAIAMFFSSFSTPYVSGFLTLGVLVVGRLLADLEAFLPRIESGLTRAALRAVVAVAPDLNLFTLTTQLTHDIAIPFVYVWHTSFYGVCYLLFFLLVGALIFQRRDFI
jgi:ABC-type transport system involved in multi-copper enzyme maturation permease subunit